MTKSIYLFELLCIEPEDIINDKAFSKGLSFSNSLWKQQEPIEKTKNGFTCLIQNNLNLEVKIVPVDTSKMVTDYVEVAFILTVTSTSFNELEEFRKRLLKHLKAKLNFRFLRVLKDEVSTDIANKLYPKINEVESTLRRYLIKFFTQRVGVEWWLVTANAKMKDKVKIRKKDRKDEFQNYIQSDIEYADFDDLGHLVYKQSSGFNEPEKALEQIISISKIEELQSFQKELQGNYVKYFKDNFRDKNFEKQWEELFKIRNKVAHQGTFYKDELERGVELHKSLIGLIKEAEEGIDELVLNIEEKEAFYNKSVDAVTHTGELLDESSQDKLRRAGIKIVDKINIDSYVRKTNHDSRIISENELIEELKRAEKTYTPYVGLKGFVTEFLGAQDYFISSSYSLINILAEKGRVIIYDEEHLEKSYQIKAIKINPKYQV